MSMASVLHAWRGLTGTENNNMIFSSRIRFSGCRNQAFEPGETLTWERIWWGIDVT